MRTRGLSNSFLRFGQEETAGPGEEEDDAQEAPTNEEAHETSQT